MSKGSHACYCYIVSSRVKKNGVRQLRIDLTLEIAKENLKYFDADRVPWIELTASGKKNEEEQTQ